LTALADEISTRVPVRTGENLQAVADSDVVVLLTAAADTLLRAEHLAPGAAVLDATQPRNTSPDLLLERPDVLLLDGGLVDVPAFRLHGGSMGLPDGRTFACLAETMLLSLSGHSGHFSLGRPTLDQIDEITDIAAAHGHLGFLPAIPSSFGRPIDLPSAGISGLDLEGASNAEGRVAVAA
jgi:predicted amino acid dehydrogenase